MVQDMRQILQSKLFPNATDGNLWSLDTKSRMCIVIT